MIVSTRRMSPRLGSILFQILLVAFLSSDVRCSSSCSQARLWTNPKPKVIDDCNILDDRLNVRLSQLTSRPLCIREVKLKFGTKWLYAPLDRQTSANIRNLFVASERCLSRTITAKVKFVSSDVEHKTNFVVNPMNCFNSTKTVYQPSTEQGILDLSQGINRKLWKTCLDTASLVTGSTNQIHLNRIQALRVPFDFQNSVCKNRELTFNFNFFGGTIKTKNIVLLKVIKQLGTNVQVIEDCDLFEDQYRVALDKIIDKPMCCEKTSVKIGTTSHWKGKVNQDYVKIKNFLGNPNMNSELNRCQKASVTVTTEVGQTKYATNFDLDPMKCFNQKKELKYEEEGNHIIFVNLTNDIAFNDKLFETCLTSIDIYDQNRTDIAFEELTEKPNNVRILDLKRLKNQTLTVQYNFQGGLKKTKQIFVPYSPSSVRLEEEKVKRNMMIKIATIVGAVTGGGLLIITMLALGCVFWRKRRAKAAEESMDIDENDTYGTYARGSWDEGEYGDGDVVEVVDNNVLYGI